VDVHNSNELIVSLMEVWGALFRSVLQVFMSSSNTNNLEEIIVSALCDFAKTDYDELAVSRPF